MIEMSTTKGMMDDKMIVHVTTKINEEDSMVMAKTMEVGDLDPINDFSALHDLVKNIYLYIVLEKAGQI